MTGHLVGPVRNGVIHFRSGMRGNDGAIAYTPPQNTLDPRYDACTDHHVACDCREAEFAEERHEWRYERDAIRQAFDAIRQAFDDILAGHSTHIHGEPNPYTGRADQPCMCTGCQIARATHHYPRKTS